jgi:hypothetical protein
LPHPQQSSSRKGKTVDLFVSFSQRGKTPQAESLNSELTSDIPKLHGFSVSKGADKKGAFLYMTKGANGNKIIGGQFDNSY